MLIKVRFEYTMIKSFKHKGLERFFETGDKSGIQAHHANRLQEQLTALNIATCPQNMNVPKWKLHKLSGSLKEHYAVTVNANWRLTFTFNGKNAKIVDYQDYH